MWGDRPMRKSRYTEEQVGFAFKRTELGTSVAEVCRKMECPIASPISQRGDGSGR